MQAVIIILLILAVLLVVFTLQNSMVITVNLFLWQIKDAPLVLVLVCCIVIGYILAIIYFYPRIWKLKKEKNKLLKSNKELKERHGLNSKLTNDASSDPEDIELDENTDSDSFFKD